MSDYFALLDEPRGPWLDPAALKQKFIRLSVLAHPDRVHSSSEAERNDAARRFADLNAAYQCLRDPKERVGHLLELELGVKPHDIQPVPPATLDLFLEVGRACREADEFLRKRNSITSPLLSVQMFEQGMEYQAQLAALQQKIATQQEGLVEELKSLN